MNNLKILILHNDLRVYWKRRLQFLHEFLKSKNIDFTAIEIFGVGSPYDFDVSKDTETWRVCLFPVTTDNQLTKSKIKDAVFSKLSEINPDIIIAGSIAFYSGALGLRWAKQNNRKFIMFDDAKPSNVKRNFLVQGIKKLITSQIDALWLPSNDYDKEYEALYSKKQFFYFYGYNCIDNQLFKLQGEKKTDHKKIVCVARLVPIKNYENLLKAWKFVEMNDDAYELIIIGDGPAFKELNSLMNTINLNRVRFLGSIDNDKLPQYLNEADAFILPSWSESWGLVVNEAMAAGLPVLLSNKINAANTLLKENDNGFSFSPGDVKNIQQKLMDFIHLSDPAKKEMSDNALKTISRMDYNNMGGELLNAISFLETMPNKRVRLPAKIAVNLWRGRYNTSSWDKL
jgi:glycosyltransferase involved in cell wall biosynthesis